MDGGLEPGDIQDLEPHTNIHNIKEFKAREDIRSVVYSLLPKISN